MQNTPALTKRKYNLDLKNYDPKLYHPILSKIEIRMEQFWKITIDSLGNEFDKSIKVKDQKQFKDLMTRIFAKQVYSMAEFDKVYKFTKKGMITDDKKIDELIELSFRIPELFAWVQNQNRKKNIRLIVDMMKSEHEGFNKPKLLSTRESEEEVFISKIKNAKEKLMKSIPPKKISVSAVSRDLGYRPKQRQSFVDKMVSLKLVNRNSVKKDFDKI